MPAQIREIAPAALDLSLGRLRLLAEPRVTEMMVSLRDKGQLSALVAASHASTPVLVDGFVRQSAAKRLGMPSVYVEVHDLASVQMKAQMYLRNRQRGLLLVEECRLVDELHRADGMDQVDIATALERHKSWVCRRLALHRHLSPNLMAQLAVGRLGGGSIQKLAQLPARNQEEIFAASQRWTLGARETTKLIELWRRAQDEEARRYVLEQPVEALRLAQGKQGEWTDGSGRNGGCDGNGEVLPNPIPQLFKALNIWSAVGNRLQGLLHKPMAVNTPSDAIRRLTEEVKRNHAQATRAIQAMESWLQKHGGEACPDR